jgi:hypothetical protein
MRRAEEACESTRLGSMIDRGHAFADFRAPRLTIGSCSLPPGIAEALTPSLARPDPRPLRSSRHRRPRRLLLRSSGRLGAIAANGSADQIDYAQVPPDVRDRASGREHEPRGTLQQPLGVLPRSWHDRRLLLPPRNPGQINVSVQQ